MAFRLFLVSLLVIVGAVAVPTVQTTDGPIYGYETEFSTYSFKGVPFAAPPLGNLRFAPPSPVSPWTTPRNATGFGPGCYSKCRGKFATLMCAATVSEDCLYLNVYTPTLSPTANLPVIVFIHGGMFSWGSGGIPLYEGDLWAKNYSVIIVTINYRLNIFGALYTNSGPKGNFNILDQRASLQWVQANIQNFGGDPNRVTVSGQSAGATSTGVHLVAPGSFKYYQRAAIISDPYGLIPLDKKRAGELGDVVLLKLGCSTTDAVSQMACLRGKTTDEIFAMADTDLLPTPDEVLAMFMQWVPVIDGDVIPIQPLVAMQQGSFNPVPLFIGTVANETIPFVFGINFNTSTFLLDVALDYVFGVEHGTEIQMLYGPVPPDQQDDTRAFFSAIFTDYSFYCPSRFAAKMASKKNGNHTFMWFFDEHPSWAIWYADGNVNDPCVKWVCHAFDLPTVFDTYWKLPASFPKPTAAEQDMSNFVQSAWAHFAANGTIPQWPAFTETSLVARNISTPIESSGLLVAYREKYCDYFDSIGYNRW